MNTLMLDTDWPVPPVLDASTVPIYDIFPCRRNQYLCVLGPHYSHHAMLNPTMRIMDAEVSGRRIHCPRNFTMVWLFEIPVAMRHHSQLSISLRIRGKDRIHHMVALAEPPPQRKLCAATMCHYDSRYLGEWIEYHRDLGIEHFYIYNNDAPDITEALDGYRECVTEIPWPYPYRVYPVADWEPWWPADSHLYSQGPQQTHACYRYGDEWKWMAHFDADEFMVPRVGGTLPEILDRYAEPDHQVGWSVPGRYFGNVSGLRTVPRGSIAKTYLKCEPGFTSGPKCIVRPDRVDTFQVHECWPRPKAMPAKWLAFNHYTAVSEHKLRRSENYDHLHNEMWDLTVLDICNGDYRPESNLSLTLLRDLIEQYGLEAFVETGTAAGATVELVAPLFRLVWTVELLEARYDAAKERLARLAGVRCLLGDSPTVLQGLDEARDAMTLYWLDAHWVGGSEGADQTACPVLEELAAIGDNTDAVILIDDARLFLAPPGPPHDPADWPTYQQIKERAETQGRYVQVIGDVIVITPTKYTPSAAT